MFQTPFSLSEKFLVFSNILLPSYFLHKNIFEVELKENYKPRRGVQALAFSVTLVTIDNICSTRSCLELHSEAVLSFKCLMLSAVTGKPKTTMSAQVLVYQSGKHYA